jgi:hypothetical protein
LALGPSSDAPVAVQIEIRACELFLSEHLRDEETAMEWAGRSMYGRDEQGPITTFGGNAGWLMAHMADPDHTPITELIAKSSIGAALADIKERGIDAHLVDLEAEMKPKRRRKR